MDPHETESPGAGDGALVLIPLIIMGCAMLVVLTTLAIAHLLPRI